MARYIKLFTLCTFKLFKQVLSILLSPNDLNLEMVIQFKLEQIHIYVFSASRTIYFVYFLSNSY